MVGFGIVIGIVFPFFVQFVLGLPSSQVLTAKFFSLCILAGISVGAFNFFVFKSVIYNFLTLISDKLTAFQEKISKAQREEAVECSQEECLIKTRSSDPIVGNITNSFNTFIVTIQDSMRAEMITNRFLEELNQGLSVKDIADVVLDAFVQYFDGDGGCILGWEHGEFTVLKSLHTIVGMEDFDQRELYQIITENKVTVYENLHKNPLKLNVVLGELVPSSMAFIPLKYQDQNVGMAILLAKDTFSRPFNNLESRNFIKQATPFLYNSSLIRRLEILAAIDELTGTLNRRFGMKRLAEEFSRARRYALSFSLCMIDLDYFKNINDTFGHQAGDEVLRSLAGQLQKDLRSSDFIVRYGGEEFLVILPGASLSDAYSVMDRIRRRVEAFALQYGSYTIKYTFSGGVCSYPSQNEINAPDDLIRQADDALYRAKEDGRNMIVIAASSK
jgi:diguanylate cyclase (GGDEF)-like protein